MWDLDALAEDGADDGVFVFWLTAAPLPVTGAVGSPTNPIAVKRLPWQQVTAPAQSRPLRESDRTRRS